MAPKRAAGAKRYGQERIRSWASKTRFFRPRGIDDDAALEPLKEVAMTAKET